MDNGNNGTLTWLSGPSIVIAINLNCWLDLIVVMGKLVMECGTVIAYRKRNWIWKFTNGNYPFLFFHKGMCYSAIQHKFVIKGIFGPMFFFINILLVFK